MNQYCLVRVGSNNTGNARSRQNTYLEGVNQFCWPLTSTLESNRQSNVSNCSEENVGRQAGLAAPFYGFSNVDKGHTEYGTAPYRWKAECTHSRDERSTCHLALLVVETSLASSQK
jgi:hypothetical protein